MGTRIYVGNLPFTATDDQIRELFGSDGRQVTEVHIVMDRDTGRPRGFAFVEMASENDARAALEALNGASFGGRSLTVNEAKERTGSGSGGGGGRGGGGGGGRY